MPINPYQPPKEESSSATERRPLPSNYKILWLAAIMFPTVFFGAAFANDALGILAYVALPGPLVYWIPLASLTVASLIVLAAPASLPTKLGWLAVSPIIMVVQFFFDILVFGLLGLYLSGMSGVH